MQLCRHPVCTVCTMYGHPTYSVVAFDQTATGGAVKRFFVFFESIRLSPQEGHRLGMRRRQSNVFFFFSESICLSSSQAGKAAFMRPTNSLGNRLCPACYATPPVK